MKVCGGRPAAAIAALTAALTAAVTAALTVVTPAAADATTAPRRSGFADMSPSTQALQRDDTQNPAMLWVSEGEQRFAADCTGCHTVAAVRGVAARYPAWDAAGARPVTLAGRINLCRTRHLKALPLAAESNTLLALEAYIALQSRGLPLQPDPAPAMQRWRAEGERLYRQPWGQLGLACAQCHDTMAGRRLAGATIPQAHPTGYPVYRLEWQGMGSLQRRLRNCMIGVRAEPYAYGSDAYTALEIYLKQRAAGMAVESPAVRP